GGPALDRPAGGRVDDRTGGAGDPELAGVPGRQRRQPGRARGRAVPERAGEDRGAGGAVAVGPGAGRRGVAGGRGGGGLRGAGTPGGGGAVVLPRAARPRSRCGGAGDLGGGAGRRGPRGRRAGRGPGLPGRVRVLVVAGAGGRG